MSATDTPTPSILWIGGALLVTQAVLYLIYPGLVHYWEFPAMAVPAVAFNLLLLWDTRHWVKRRTTHVIHVLIVIDTLAEGLLQGVARKEARHNLYCVAAFAVVLVLWRIACLAGDARSAPAEPAPPTAQEPA